MGMDKRLFVHEGLGRSFRSDSADCVLEEFVNFDLEISVIVSGNGKDVTVFPVQEKKYPSQQYPVQDHRAKLTFQKV